MSALIEEWRRLYLLSPVAPPGAAPAQLGRVSPQVDAQGRTRALVLEVCRPASWQLLGEVWRGVQTDLGWPAPAIAATGVDGLQLWFSLAAPLDAAAGRALLAGLCRRYLPDLPAARLRLFPSLAPTLPATSSAEPDAAQALAAEGALAAPAARDAGWQHAAPVPAMNPATGDWSTFVAPDLAPLFADTPWLDVPPGDEGQAKLLARLTSISTAAWAAALAGQARSADAAEPPEPESAAAPLDRDAGSEAVSDAPLADPASPASVVEFDDPRHFLLAVMNDAAVPMALRIEAAKALLPSRG